MYGVFGGEGRGVQITSEGNGGVGIELNLVGLFFHSWEKFLGENFAVCLCGDLEQVQELREDGGRSFSSAVTTTNTTTHEVLAGSEGVKLGVGGEGGLDAGYISTPARDLVGALVDGAREVVTSVDVIPVVTYGGGLRDV